MTLDRRKFLVGSGLAAGAALSAGLVKRAQSTSHDIGLAPARGAHGVHAGSMGTVGQLRTDDFDPFDFVTRYEWGDRVTDLGRGDGSQLREYTINAVDKMLEVAPGVEFAAWTYNGQVPGPTLRCNEGDRIRITFRNDGTHPHTIHFHGVHTPIMDGIPGVGDGEIMPGDETVYEFDALPYGLHLYHCHSLPLKRHIHKGLYGAFIIDPRVRENGPPPQDADTIHALSRQLDAGEPMDGVPGGQTLGSTGFDAALGEAAHEFVMVMNGFDTNFDGGNEVYAVNTKAFAYAARPLKVRAGELVRVHLVNLTEFDPVNSIHLHAYFFDYYDTGRLENRRSTIDTVMQCQAERGILQFRAPFEGPLMFHAHQSEFAELGWMGFFEVEG